jgi:hypothetical protein
MLSIQRTTFFWTGCGRTEISSGEASLLVVRRSRDHVRAGRSAGGGPACESCVALLTRPLGSPQQSARWLGNVLLEILREQSVSS